MTSQGQHATPSKGANAPLTPPNMRAVVQSGYGSADVLRLTEMPRPSIKADEVLIRVHAAGLDRGAWHLMTGRPYLLRLGFGIRGPKRPIPGSEVAGTVAEVGSAVTRFRVGDQVFGVGRGSFAQYTAAREDKLAHKPARASFEQAAVVPVSALTALQGLRNAGHVTRGQRVLIVGASGGVGSFAVQLAKAFGAEVTGVCSSAKLDFVRSLGADRVIDYTQEDFADGIRSYHLILDIGGSSRVSRLRRALTPSGTLVFVGGEGSGNWLGMRRQLRGLALSPFVRQRLTMFVGTQSTADLEFLAGLMDSGSVTPRVDRAFSLDQVADAMRYLEAGTARGKVAIAI